MYLFFQRTATTTENNTNKTTPKINPMIREKLESPILRDAWIVAPVEKNRNEFKYFCNLKQFQGLNYFSSEKITRREDSRFLTRNFLPYPENLVRCLSLSAPQVLPLGVLIKTAIIEKQKARGGRREEEKGNLASSLPPPIVPRALSVFLLPSLPTTQKRRLRRRKRLSSTNAL